MSAMLKLSQKKFDEFDMMIMNILNKLPEFSCTPRYRAEKIRKAIFKELDIRLLEE